MTQVPKPSEHRTVLQKVSWQKYEKLLAEMNQNARPGLPTIAAL